MRIWRKNSGPLICLVAALLWVSCRGTHSRVGAEEIPLPQSMEWLDSLEVQPPPPGWSKDWRKHQRRMDQWETFSGRIRMKYQGPGQDHEFSAQVRMKKEEAIWVSVSAMGGMVSVGRALVRPDSIQFISYLQKQAWALPLEKAAALLPFPLDFSLLESLILGQAIEDTAYLEEQELRGAYFLVHRQGESGQFMEIYDQRSLHLRQLLQESPRLSFFSRMDLHRYQPVGKRDFSHQREWTIVDGPQWHRLDMEFSQTRFDQELSLPFSIPSGFAINP